MDEAQDGALSGGVALIPVFSEFVTDAHLIDLG